MKGNFTTVAIILIATVVSAQTETQNDQVLAGFNITNKATTLPVVNTGKVASLTDTTGWVYSGNFYPNFNISDQIVLINYTWGGYIYGNNTIGYNECAQGYVNNHHSTFSITEALLMFGAKQNVSNNPASKCVINVWDMANNKARNTTGGGGSAINSPGPNNLLASKDLLLSDIDTSATSGGLISFTAVTFDSPVLINGTDFAISVDFTNLNSLLDTAGLISDYIGDAQELDYSFIKDQGEWVVSDYAYNFNNPNFTGALDNNIAIFAVIDENVVGVESLDFFNGMKLSQNQPNPSNGNTVIQYELEKYSTGVELEIFDIHGRKAVVVSEGEKAAGRHSISVNSAKLSAGTYYYSVIANGNRLTKKMVVN